MGLAVRRSVAAAADRSRAAMRDGERSDTIVSLLWLTCLFGLLILTTDASLVRYGKAQAVRVLRDGNRAYVDGRLATTSDVEDWLTSAIRPLGPHASATTTVSGGIVRSTLTMPASDLMLFDSMGRFDVTVRSEHPLD